MSGLGGVGSLRAPFERRGEHLTIALAGSRAVFTTRRGGFSTGPFESLNLGRLTDDSPEAVERNRGRLQEQVGRPLAMVRQVHGRRVLRMDLAPGAAPLQEADAIVTRGKALAPAVLVADCLPVVVAGEGELAVLHAGWRGLAAGILESGVRALRESRPSGRLLAAIGPGIGPCCYEVGEEVHTAFASYGPSVRRGRHLDLAGVARRALEQAGVEEIHSLGLCTACHPDLFFSHRRDSGLTGRQAAVAWLT
jgi:YfiH family protein